MKNTLPLSHPCQVSGLRLFALLFSAAALGPVAHAEKADRLKPLNIEADNGRYDDAKQIGVFTGNVVVTKGTMSMRAAKIEVRQTPDGAQFGVATAESDKRAVFRQKRDGLDEYIEGEGERIEYDGKADTIRFINRAVIRRFRGATLADETAGSVIVYDNTAEVFSVVGGAAAATPSNPSGRVRAVLTPREVPAAADAASQPGVTLRPSTSLGEKR
ncbi:MAG: lipopolysaccharide transport periplasmic protein LptA [Burkholderiaceae bacterium]|nr:lipopolysaccharide transport periplasmic protein LptA [Burkholderiaceae bacterium]